jgi:hypothetical protein
MSALMSDGEDVSAYLWSALPEWIKALHGKPN